MSNVLKITDENFKQEVNQSDIPVVVDFYAEWCGPCKMIAPMIESLADEYEGKVKFAKINVDEYHIHATEYSIKSIPAIIFFKGGIPVDTSVGLQQRNILEEKIKSLL